MPMVYRPVGGDRGYKVGLDGTVWTCLMKIGRGKGKGTNWVPGKQWVKLKPAPARGGYVRVKIRGRKRPVHQLVLETFVGKCPDGMQARHLNGMRTDNRRSNLAWGTKKENENDKISHGTWPEGEKNGHARLTESDVVNIRRISAIGRRGCINRGLSHSKVAAIYGISKNYVSRIVTNRAWKCVPEVFR